MLFFTNRKNLFNEIFYCSYLWQVIAHFGKDFFFFMIPYIIKRRRSFVLPSVNQSLYTLALKQRGLQHRNLVQRYWRGFLRKISKQIVLKIDQDFLE